MTSSVGIRKHFFSREGGTGFLKGAAQCPEPGTDLRGVWTMPLSR